MSGEWLVSHDRHLPIVYINADGTRRAERRQGVAACFSE
jgi:hypothetical protein